MAQSELRSSGDGVPTHTVVKISRKPLIIGASAVCRVSTRISVHVVFLVARCYKIGA